MNNKMIVIAGATATGKTSVAIELAKKINGEIVSADSMQVYKYMNIGTAKPNVAEMKGIAHHLIDVVEPDFSFNAAIFTDMAKTAVKDIHSRGKIPILTGGTGFYINAVVYNNDFMSTIESNNKEIRQKLNTELETYGAAHMFEMLEKIDPEYAETTHMNNTKRVIRALEFYYETGTKFSIYNKQAKEKRSSNYITNMFILNREREVLYRGINDRVDEMIENGLIDEVKWLLNNGYHEELVSMQGLGYKEICNYINNKRTLLEATEDLKQGTRRFAKRQITWFKHQAQGEWIDVDEYSSPIIIADEIIKMID